MPPYLPVDELFGRFKNLLEEIIKLKESKKVYNTIFFVFVHSERISFVKTQLIKCDQELVEIPWSVIASPCQPTKHLRSRRQHLQI